MLARIRFDCSTFGHGLRCEGITSVPNSRFVTEKLFLNLLDYYSLDACFIAKFRPLKLGEICSFR